jgi:hypothetical protein
LSKISLVERYKRRPAVVAWELMNELDLQADLRHKGARASDIAFGTIF